MLYRPKNFVIEELVPPTLLKAYGEEKCWQQLDPYALFTLQTLRDKRGRITVNNWHVGGPLDECGLREASTGVGAKLSQHKRGCAFDCHPNDCTPQELYAWVLANPHEVQYMNRVENIAATPTWFHFDAANAPSRIMVVNP